MSLLAQRKLIRRNLQLAEIALSAGDARKSLKITQQILHKDPDDLSLLEMIARCYWKLGLMGDLEQVLKHLIAIHPYEPSYFSMLASALTVDGRIGEAIRSYRRAIDLTRRPDSSLLQLYQAAQDFQDEMVVHLLHSDSEFRFQYRENPDIALAQRGFEPREKRIRQWALVPIPIYASISTRPS